MQVISNTCAGDFPEHQKDRVTNSAGKNEHFHGYAAFSKAIFGLHRMTDQLYSCYYPARRDSRLITGVMIMLKRLTHGCAIALLTICPSSAFAQYGANSGACLRIAQFCHDRYDQDGYPDSMTCFEDNVAGIPDGCPEPTESHDFHVYYYSNVQLCYGPCFAGSPA